MRTEPVKLVDEDTGQPPVLRNGDEIAFTTTVITTDEGNFVIPDAMTTEGEPVILARVEMGEDK